MYIYYELCTHNIQTYFVSFIQFELKEVSKLFRGHDYQQKLQTNLGCVSLTKGKRLMYHLFYRQSQRKLFSLSSLTNTN